eukprot:GHVH01000895.1.p1 GENE.GHVH01000895.1~~GHVH01000895.1.p1  ORF type:complete len:450 (+),score=67.82 GHVH01000895.1:226-1575(+)
MDVTFPPSGFNVTIETCINECTRFEFFCEDMNSTSGFIIEIEVEEHECEPTTTSPQQERLPHRARNASQSAHPASTNCPSSPYKDEYYRHGSRDNGLDLSSKRINFASVDESLADSQSTTTVRKEGVGERSVEFGSDLPVSYTRKHTVKEFESLMQHNLARSMRSLRKSDSCCIEEGIKSDEEGSDYEDDNITESEGGDEVASVFVEAMRSMTRVQKKVSSSDSGHHLQNDIVIQSKRGRYCTNRADKSEQAHQFLHGNYMASRANLSRSSASHGTKEQSGDSTLLSTSSLSLRGSLDEDEFIEEGGVDVAPQVLCDIIRAASSMQFKGVPVVDVPLNVEAGSDDSTMTPSSHRATHSDLAPRPEALPVDVDSHICSSSDELLHKEISSSSNRGAELACPRESCLAVVDARQQSDDRFTTRSVHSSIKREDSGATVEDFLPSCSSFHGD